MCKSRDQLVKIRIDPCPTNMFEIIRFVWWPKDALIDFVIGLHNELRLSLVRSRLDELPAYLIEEVMQSVFSHRLLLLAMS